MSSGKKLAPRLLSLRTELEKEFANVKRHMLLCDDEQRAYAEISNRAYAASKGKAEVSRCADFLKLFAEDFPIGIRKDELIVGSQRFTHPDWGKYLTEEQRKAGGSHSNMGHIVVDYGRMVKLGVSGVREEIRTMPQGVNREAFSQTLQAFSTFIRRHADACARAGFADIAAICANTADKAPQTFHEALQMVWFIQIFLHAEGNSAAVSFGRFDQYLWPSLKRDLARKRINRDEALELLCCFFMKCCEGDESQNLIVGGSDLDGISMENPLSLLALEACRKIKVWQPSLSVRIGKSTSDKFWKEALLLSSAGTGMPSFFNETVVASGLKKLGIPAERAMDWGIIGCYEAAPQGDSFPMTVAGNFALPTILWDFLKTNTCEKGDFTSFYSEFKSFFRSHYEQKTLPSFIERWDNQKRNCPSPFESICVTGCIESGLTTVEGGAKFNLFGVNILGLGTLIDSLLSIKKLIYEHKEFTLAQMREQLGRDFPDQKLLLRCRSLSGKFGSDSAETNLMAKDLSAYFANIVISKPLPNGVRPYPGFFWFGADIGIKLPASADGRKENDRLSYGCGPGIFLKDPTVTAILNSAANLDHESCACGNPLTLSLNKSDVGGKAGIDRMRQILETYFKKGGFHLQFNILSAKDLRNAKEKPEKHQGLTVRISGYSARFVTLDPRWQDALIERTDLGM
ncbi:MAG: pyruvate formate lyase family protein [Victivallales bacterium]